MAEKKGLTADGLVGPMTYRRVGQKESLIYLTLSPEKDVQAREENHIVHNGHHISIDWDKVILWDEAGRL